MITPQYVRVMAEYNTEMNRRVYAAAGRLDEAARQGQEGAFWGSVQGTLSHILWADRMWMSRFAGHEKPAADMAGSARMADSFAALWEMRARTDEAISAWAATLDPAWLEGELAWYSGVLGRDMRAPAALLVAHFFNHQTHHRGQAHALLTRAGETTGDTDLFLVVPATAA